MGENLSFGKSRGDEYMISLFIDDGVSDRGHRQAICNEKYFKVGIAYCNHNSDYHGMVAIAYATDFVTSMEGEQEIERRFESRRVGSNAEKSSMEEILVEEPWVGKDLFDACRAIPLIISAKQTAQDDYNQAIQVRKTLLTKLLD